MNRSHEEISNLILGVYEALGRVVVYLSPRDEEDALNVNLSYVNGALTSLVRATTNFDNLVSYMTLHMDKEEILKEAEGLQGFLRALEKTQAAEGIVDNILEMEQTPLPRADGDPTPAQEAPPEEAAKDNSERN